ncbi:MAG: hypothetical protein RMM10_07750 [Anaerolineae bacterium]|uniref:hypothetical protein n=1 Tax=Thermoflexus sp. TaxID=1969742 RepID=UPI0025F476AA|nr:hypothetical protein [Thermoflexus sp.]MCS7351401.1 hypothetical protein [Thermoflexus sp.]MDW8180857.1 hypothetical protein [Anaerolineae bacterium]
MPIQLPRPAGGSWLPEVPQRGLALADLLPIRPRRQMSGAKSAPKADLDRHPEEQ